MSEPTPHPYEPVHSRALRWMKAVELPDPRFGRVLRLARKVLDVPVSLVCLGPPGETSFQAEAEDPGAAAVSEIATLCAGLVSDQSCLVHEDVSREPGPHGFADTDVRFLARQDLVGPDGSIEGWLCVADWRARDLSRIEREIFADLASLAQSEIQRLRLETIDEVTTLPNRRGFLFIAGRTLALRARAGAPASLLTLDLWGGPSANAPDEPYGVRSFARLLLDCFRDSDVAARLGRKEFCVLLSPEHEDDVEIALGRLEQAVDRWNAAENGNYRLRFRSHIVDFDAEADGDLSGLLEAAESERVHAEPPPTVGGGLSLLRAVREEGELRPELGYQRNSSGK